VGRPRASIADRASSSDLLAALGHSRGDAFHDGRTYTCAEPLQFFEPTGDSDARDRHLEPALLEALQWDAVPSDSLESSVILDRPGR